MWWVSAAAGACLAWGVGHGTAAADADSSDSSRTARSSESSASPGRSVRTQDDDTASRRSRSTDDGPEAVPASVTERATGAPESTDEDAETSLKRETATDERPRDTRRRAARSARDDAPANTLPQQQVSEPAVSAPAAPVTGVKTGRAPLTIPVGTRDYTARTDWYLPTQADGSTAATGVIWLQHGFLGSKSMVSALARTLSQQTNSIVVAPTLPSLPGFSCSGCWINGEPMQQAVATMFLGDRTALTSSAAAAGYLGALPQDFVLSGHSGGGGFATSVGGFYAADPTSSGDLRGVVMFDGVAWRGRLSSALDSLSDPFVPVYQIAAPSSPWNSSSRTTRELVAARPDQFVGVTLARGSHADAVIGGNPILDLLAQLVAGVSPPGNTAAATLLATGWTNDLFAGRGPDDGEGIYGTPGQYIVMGDTAAVVLAAPSVDLPRYLGTWYEVGSVKQFFSLGLVNTTAVYSLNPDGSIRVQNSGNYFVDNGPRSSIVGAALPVDPAGNKLNVRFFGPASARPPGNYWIVDLDPDYRWAVVTDPTGRSGFLLSRTRTVSDDLYRELLDRASVAGVVGRITPTRQPADQTTSA